MMTYQAADKYKLSFLISILFIYLMAIYIQQQLFLNWDVSTLLQSTEKLLKGGTYIQDFLTPNLPMIMLLYAIPLVFSQMVHINVIYIFPLFIFLLASISFIMSYQLTLTIFRKEDKLQAYLFLCTLLTIFLIAPLYELGQRDHLLVVMTMPYLLLTVCRLENKPINTTLAIFIGLFAAIALGFKPQFLILPLLLESYFLIRKRSLLAWIKPETIAIMGLLLVYVLYILVTYQNYYKIIAPYLVQNYYHYADHRNLFLYAGIINYWYAALGTHLVLNRFNQYKTLGNILALALLAYTVTYLTQRYPLFYHQVPALSLAILMLVQLYVNLVSHYNYSWREDKLIALAIAGWLAYIYYFWYGVVYSLYFTPVTSFVFVAILSLTLLTILKPTMPIRYKIAALAFIITMGCMISFIGININFVYIQMIATLLTILLLLSFCISTSLKKATSVFLISLLGILMFIIPVTAEKTNYKMIFIYKSEVLGKLIAFIHTQPAHTSIYTFSMGTGFTFPLSSYTDTVVKQRFDSLWMVSPINDKILARGDQGFVTDIRNNNSPLFLNIINEDLQKGKPDIIFIEQKLDGKKDYLGFDYLHYFLFNKTFSQIWQHYQYLTTLESEGMYKLKVYKRVDNDLSKLTKNNITSTQT